MRLFAVIGGSPKMAKRYRTPGSLNSLDRLVVAAAPAELGKVRSLKGVSVSRMLQDCNFAVPELAGRIRSGP
jgi:hypothetical protein